MNALKSGHKSDGCFYYVIRNRIYGLFTILTLSLYVVNNTVYMFGAKWVSAKRIIIELIIELIYGLILNFQFIKKYLDHKLIVYGIDLNRLIWQSPAMLSICIFNSETIYYIMCSYFYHKNMTKPIISMTIFQILGIIIIMLFISDVFINAFNYFECIQALQYSLCAGYLLLEPFKFSDQSNIDEFIKNAANH